MNRVSYVCRSVQDSVKFYENVLRFLLIKKPSSFKFQGAWLFNYGIGIHLLDAMNIEYMTAVVEDFFNWRSNYQGLEQAMKVAVLYLDDFGFAGGGKNCSAEEAHLMMNNLMIDLLKISI
ncbi:glyoxylase I 4-like [Cicer arietinum]|uniref:glyoxylase I 4-like n=1 Tax=Cicer arietinum TaxID=3827 RepID=UPI003CC58C0B